MNARRLRVLHTLRRRLIFLIVFVIYLLVVLYKAWVADDAFITFRVIDNLFHGDGLTWNPPDRVQVYTHPLWMLVMSLTHFVTRDFYYTSMFVGLVFSSLAILLLGYKLSKSSLNAGLAAALLLLSQAFTDYSTSGLENSLTHVLLALFLIVYFADRPQPKNLLRLSLIAALLMLNRLDTALLVLPALAFVVLQARTRRTLRLVCIGFLPLMAWGVFSLVYYGFLLPNSAYAKLGSGLDRTLILLHGGRYFLNSLQWDPVTLLGCTLGVASGGMVALRSRGEGIWRCSELWVSVGVCLYLFYVWMIGGDFMSGRFFTAPLFAAVVLIARAAMPPRIAWTCGAVIALILVSRIFLPHGNQDDSGSTSAQIDDSGIADERLFYLHKTSLRNFKSLGDWPASDLRQEAESVSRTWRNDSAAQVFEEIGLLESPSLWPPGKRAVTSEQNDDPVIIRGAVGMLAYQLGRSMHVIDYYAVTDPLLARLPALLRDPALELNFPKLGGLDWRIGHFSRAIPSGYPKTLSTGENHFTDPLLAEFYSNLSLVTRGDVFRWDRLQTILRFNLGRYDHQFIEYAQRNSPAGRNSNFDYVAAHLFLGTDHMVKANYDQAIDHLRRVLVLDSRNTGALNNLAWLLATCPQGAIRDGNAALALAQRAEQALGKVTIQSLDTLAAAQAESGDFERATASCEKARNIAQATGDQAMVQKLASRLQLYGARQAYRMAPVNSARH